MMTSITVRITAGHVTAPLDPVSIFQGSAATVGVIDVPRTRFGCTVTGCAVAIENVAGVVASVAAKSNGNVWTATFPAAHFAACGIITGGIVVTLTGKDENGTTRTWIVGRGNVKVIAADGVPAPGTTATHITDRTFEGETVDITTEDGMSAGLKKVLAKLGATVVSSFVISMAAFGAVPEGYTNDTYTADGVTWARHGALNTRNAYVVTNVVGGGSGGIDTNAVRDIAASAGVTNAGAVAAAQAYADAHHDSTKQDALTAAQTNAVNSGITSSKVATYDGYATGKLPATFTEPNAWVVNGHVVFVGDTEVYRLAMQDRLALTQWDYLTAGSNYQPLPTYLGSLSWAPNNVNLADYGIVDAYTKTAANANFVPWVTDYETNKTAVTIGERDGTRRVGPGSFAMGEEVAASGDGSFAHGINVHASGMMSRAEGVDASASGLASHAEGIRSSAGEDYSFVWSGTYEQTTPPRLYSDHGEGTFNLNPKGGLAGLWIGATNMATYIANASSGITASDATNIAVAANAPLAQYATNTAAAVAFWDGYWQGDRVRLSVTNYYGSTSGELPRLRIEESITNAEGEVTGWQTVWDENNKYTNLLAQVSSYMAAATNDIFLATWRMMNQGLATAAPRAWQGVTSAGAVAPPNTVWHTAPSTVFAGGTEYAHVQCGEGVIAVLAARGANVCTEGEEGKFRFQDDTGTYFFGFDVATGYTIGCNTDGIATTTVGGNTLVTLNYNLTSSSRPIIEHTTNLTSSTSWVELAAEDVSWSDPSAGVQQVEINAGPSPRGFYRAKLTYAGSAKFLTNMPFEPQAGIMATNTTLHVMQNIRPKITNGTVTWEVIQ